MLTHTTALCRAFLLLVLAGPPATADPIALPPVNLGDTSFLDGKAGPTTLVQLYATRIQFERITNGNGDAVPGDNEIGISVLMAQLAHISTYKLFGGFYGAEILLPAVHINPDTDIGLNESEGGVGDLIISPLFIQWTEHKLFEMPFWHRLNFIFVLPTGEYDRNADVNPGSNSYHFNPYYAGTLDITPRLSASYRMHYLWNSENDEPHPLLAAKNIQSGSAFHVNYAASYHVKGGLRLGVAGYYLEQLTDDRIDGVSVSDSKERVFAIGPGLMYQNNSWAFTANGYLETAAKNRPEGYRITLHLARFF